MAKVKRIKKVAKVKKAKKAKKAKEKRRRNNQFIIYLYTFILSKINALCVRSSFYFFFILLYLFSCHKHLMMAMYFFD
jgi:hypothetical protein